MDPRRPYAFLVEPELSAEGTVDDVATLFLTNRECPFRCVFCDLWKNTIDERVPVGAIPEQIDFALARLPAARDIKLYNSGNFFDSQAIPPEDWPAIADRVRGFRTVIVENHPKLCGDACVRFRDLLQRGSFLAPGGGEGWGEGRMSLDSDREQRSESLAPDPRPLSAFRGEGGTQLEIALGLETVHPDVLSRLNKRMTVDDFDRAVEFLTANDIAVRAFVLLKPPFLDETDAVEWCLRSVEHAIAVGARCVSIIPTRAGNGIMDELQREGLFMPPSFAAIEQVFDRALETRLQAAAVGATGGLSASASGTGGQATRGTRRSQAVPAEAGTPTSETSAPHPRPLSPFGGEGRSVRVFIDTWDIERFSGCSTCAAKRAERLQTMNLTQRLLPPVVCECQT